MCANTFDERIAELYDEVVGGGYHLQNGYLDGLLEIIPKGSSVLEVGCGTGLIMLPLIENGIQCEGVDSSEEMVQRLLQKKSDAIVYVGDVREFDPLKQYDYVLSCSGPFSVKGEFMESYILDEEELREAMYKCVLSSRNGLIINKGKGKDGFRVGTSQGIYEKSEEINCGDVVMRHRLFQRSKLVGEITHNKKRFCIKDILGGYEVEEYGSFILVKSIDLQRHS